MIAISTILLCVCTVCMTQSIFENGVKIKSTKNTLVVRTKYGPVQGLKRTSALGKEFLSFRGIPYAEPPIGELRFKDPEPHIQWTHTIDATKASMGCPSVNASSNSADGNENCLKLNVYTKAISPCKLLPVMVWIYGGGFSFGDSSEILYGLDYLLEEDIVFVSMNYRVGVLGFLAIDDPSVNVPGNAGLKDQTLALKWVQDNVQYFGGDNKKITLFGESAGAASVHFHMLSDHSKDLFDKAIIQSGSALDPWCNVPRLNWAERLGKKLGWDGVGGERKLVEFLRKVHVNDLILAQDTRTEDEKRHWIYSAWVPSVEQYVSKQSFIIKRPFDTYTLAWGNAIPLLIGGVTEEGLLEYRDVIADPVMYRGKKAFENLIPKEWGFSNKKVHDLGASLKDSYVGSENNVGKFLDIVSDKYFWHGTDLAVKGRLQHTNSASTYLYRFAFSGDPKLNIVRESVVPTAVKGVCHGEDLAYLFKSTLLPTVPTVNSAEYKKIERMTSMFTQFASTGNPNCDIIKPVVWKSIANNSTPPYKCLNIDKELSFILYPETSRIALWTSMHLQP